MERKVLQEGIIYVVAKEDEVVAFSIIQGRKYASKDGKKLGREGVIQCCANTMNLFEKFPNANEFLDEYKQPWPSLSELPNNPPEGKYPVEEISYKDYQLITGDVL